MNHHRGFTLLELLIGMTLLGFMLALLFAGFRLASDSWDAADRQIVRTTDEEMSRVLMRRLLSQLQPVHWKRAMNQPVAFSGQPEGFRGLAPMTGQAGAGGLRLVELRGEAATQDGKDSFRLILRQAPIRYDVDDFTAGLNDAKDHVLLTGLAGVSFAYFGQPKNGDSPQWYDKWPESDNLPQLVRVRIGSPDPGWTDLLVAPMINGAGCLWDNFYKRCR